MTWRSLFLFGCYRLLSFFSIFIQFYPEYWQRCILYDGGDPCNPTISWYIEVTTSLIIFQLSFIVFSSSSYRQWKAWNLMLRVILNSLSLSISWRRVVLEFGSTAAPVVHCFEASVSFWPLPDGDMQVFDRLFVLTSYMVLFNTLFMQMGLIWFSVLWCVENHAALCMRFWENIMILFKAHKFANL